MYCFTCGNPVPDVAKFCPNCGSKLDGMPESAPEAGIVAAEAPASQVQPIVVEAPVQVEPAAAVQAEPAVAVQPEPAMTSAPAAQPTPAVAPASEVVVQTAPEPAPEPAAVVPPAPAVAPAPAPAAQPNPAYAPQPGVQLPPTGAQGQPVYPQGCVAAAVADVKGDPLLVKNSLLLGLIGCVPILNFVLYGYALNWAREIPFGGRTSMPSKLVNGHNFEIGFYAFLISLVAGLVLSVASLIGLIPILGAIAVFVLCLGITLFQYLLQMRMGMSQQLGEGFKIKDAWSVMQRNWTGLLCACFAPGLVASGVILVASLVVTLLLVGAMVPAMVADVGLAYAVSVIAYIVVMVVFVLLCGICVAASTVVAFRAVGHWIARYAPEWAAETQQQAYYSMPM